ncbi:ATP-grasp domain-containing protein [Candidatus Bipolaricaulota bacterium]
MTENRSRGSDAKRILILGVGNAQVDAIRHCRSLGHEVLGVSYRQEGPGLRYVNAFAQIDICDVERLVGYSRCSQVDIVYSVGSDFATTSVALVSEALDLPHYVSSHVASSLVDKGKVRDTLHQQGTNTVPYKVASQEQDLHSWKSLPAVVKPVDSQGQRGVWRVESRDDLLAAFERSRQFSRVGKVIVEEYISGNELSVNLHLHRGEVRHFFVSDRFSVLDMALGIPKGHRFPCRLAPGQESLLRSTVQSALQAFGIEAGPVFMQLKNTRGCFHLIEIAGRLDGCHLWRLIKQSAGVDLLAESFAGLGVGKLAKSSSNYSLGKSCHRFSLVFDLEKPGVPYTTPKRRPPGTVFQEVYYQDREIVRSTNTYLEKTGYYIVDGDGFEGEAI